jgi:hypothetical protein
MRGKHKALLLPLTRALTRTQQCRSIESEAVNRSTRADRGTFSKQNQMSLDLAVYLASVRYRQRESLL